MLVFSFTRGQPVQTGGAGGVGAGAGCVTTVSVELTWAAGVTAACVAGMVVVVLTVVVTEPIGWAFGLLAYCVVVVCVVVTSACCANAADAASSRALAKTNGFMCTPLGWDIRRRC
jgi:peptidoglycan/LPS O-acetylase OafA/YrhL